MTRPLRAYVCILVIFLAFCACSVHTFSLAAKTAVVVLKDHSPAAVGLFNNMRTPAALIAGSIVPLGLLGTPPIEKDDSKFLRMAKRVNILLASASLLSELLAVVYSSIAINKLTEIASPATSGVAELIRQHHELSWIGTNIHFIFGLLGFGLIVGGKAYFSFGNPVGKIAVSWSLAAFFQALSVVNRGIAQGAGVDCDCMKGGSINDRFAVNFFMLCVRYVSLVSKHARGGVCSMAACATFIYSLITVANYVKGEISHATTQSS